MKRKHKTLGTMHGNGIVLDFVVICLIAARCILTLVRCPILDLDLITTHDNPPLEINKFGSDESLK